MTTLQITEITDGQKNNWTSLFLTSIQHFINLLTFPFRLLIKLFGRRHNYFRVTDNDWTSSYWYSVNGQPIERKIIAETGFDDSIKFYQLRTTDKNINEQLKGKIFGEFICETPYGLFLRQFDNPDEWPISYLVFIDKSDNSFKRLKKINSSWTEWKCEFINDKDFNIITEHTDTYTTRLTIKI